MKILGWIIRTIVKALVKDERTRRKMMEIGKKYETNKGEARQVEAEKK